MLRLWLFILALYTLAPSPAFAFLSGQPIGMLNPQALPSNASAGLPAVDDDLTANGYPIAGGRCAEWGHNVPCNNHYSITRASTKYVSASDGLLISVPVNVLALGSSNGALIEETRTNDALWSRVMTNAAWVKTTMTTTLNAVGVDGGANSATTLTATGALAMAVQTITLGSQSDTYSVYLKRVTGSGTINLCLAATACGTATACTVTSTTTFTRCTVTATVLNPIVGIQIATNGDAVIADFNQMEPGGFPTSPILTTTVAASRSADVVAIIGSISLTISGTTGTIVSNTNVFPLHTAALLGLNASNNAVSNNSGSSNTLGHFNGSSIITATFGTGTWATTPAKSGFSFASGGRSIVVNNGTLVTDANIPGSFASASYQLGSLTSAFQLDSYFARETVFGTRIPDATLKAMTQ